MFTINSKDIKRLESELKTFAKRAFPFATKNTVNRAAFQAQRSWQHEIKDKLTTRNQFTAKSIRVEQTRTLNVRQQAAIVGSVAPYMDEQEFGGTKHSGGKHGVPITTSYHAGQEGARPRTRLPPRKRQLVGIQLRKSKQGRGGKRLSRKQRNMVKIRQAAESGSKYVYLDLRRGEGIFKVIGGRKKPRIKMLYDLSRKSVLIPATPTLGPAVAATKRAIPLLYKAALTEQLRRRGIFKSRLL
jgi:hypothetical protein